MAEQKTKKTKASVQKFLAGIENDRRREDCRVVVEIMRKVTGDAPAMWGPSIIGFGSYHYKYDSGHEGDAPITGVSPRKSSLSIYIMTGFDQHEELLEKLGKYKTGKCCLYVNKLDDVHLPTLRKLIRLSFQQIKKAYCR